MSVLFVFFCSEITKYGSDGKRLGFVVTKGVWYALRCYMDLAPAQVNVHEVFYSQHATLNGAKVGESFIPSMMLNIFLFFILRTQLGNIWQTSAEISFVGFSWTTRFQMN